MGRRSFTKEAECQLGIDGFSVNKRIFATSINDSEGSKLFCTAKNWDKSSLEKDFTALTWA